MVAVGPRDRGRVLALTLLALALGIGLLAPTAGASLRAPGSLAAKAVRDYWTPARMRAAIPAGAAPLAAGDRAKRRTIASRVAKPKSRRMRTHGKVFFTITPYDFECSGTSARAPSHSLVITAGHCSYDRTLTSLGSNAITNWMFVPAYSHGRAPYGKWPGTTTATSQWQASSPTISPTGDILGGDLRFDVGAGKVVDRRRQDAAVGGRRAAAWASTRAASAATWRSAIPPRLPSRGRPNGAATRR